MAESNAFIQQFDQILGETNMLYHEAALRLGLSDSAMGLLYTLSIQGNGCPISVIIRQSGLSKQTINSALRKMETEGVVYLKSEGGRRKRVYLTEAGMALAQRTVSRLIAMENGIFEAWTREDCERYIELARRYMEDFRKGLEGLS